MPLKVIQSKVLILKVNDSFSDQLTVLLTQIGVDQVLLAESFQEANPQLKKYRPHACILDIEDETSRRRSLNFATKIREAGENIPIIFLAPNIQDKKKYGNALEYKYSNVLNKNLSPSNLLQGIKYALLQFENSILVQENNRHNYLDPNAQILLSSKRNRQRLFFKIGSSFKAIKKKEISIFFIEDKLTYARVGKRNFPTNVQLKTLEAELFPDFARCHKKYVINISHIDWISTKDDKVKVKDQVLPIGYSYRKSLLNSLTLLR